MTIVSPPRLGHLIVVEGLTGSGKSTVSRLLADRLGFHWVEAVGPEYRGLISSLDNDRRGLDAHYAAYLSTVLRSASNVQARLSEGTGCVTDSWVHRTHLTHKVLGSTLRVVDPVWLPRADAVFWLDVPQDERWRRVRDRGVPNTLWKKRLESLSSELEAAYFEHVDGLIRVDGTAKAADVVEGLISQVLCLRDKERNE